MADRGRIVREAGDPAPRQLLVYDYRLMYRVNDEARGDQSLSGRPRTPASAQTTDAKGVPMRIMSVLAATGVGAAVGWVCGLVPVWPVARLAVASVMGSVFGAIGVLVFAFVTPGRAGSGGVGAVSHGLSEVILLGVPTIALIAVAAYFALRWLGWSAASLATYGPIIFGGVAALVAALWMARGFVQQG